MLGNYQLRAAAGFYWLIDMTQDGRIWKRPVRLNETGARIVQGMAAKRTPEQIAQELSAVYGLPAEQLCGDVNRFLGELRTSGIQL